MSRHVALVLLAGLLVAGDKPRESPRKTDVKDLQGTWVAVELKGFGADVAREHVSKLKLTVKGHEMTARYGDHTARGTFTLHATKVPQWIDVKLTEGPEKYRGKIFPGIYLLEGNNLLIAFRAPGQERPEDFLKVDSKGVYNIRFKRQKE